MRTLIQARTLCNFMQQLVCHWLKFRALHTSSQWHNRNAIVMENNTTCIHSMDNHPWTVEWPEPGDEDEEEEGGRQKEHDVRNRHIKCDHICAYHLLYVTLKHKTAMRKKKTIIHMNVNLHAWAFVIAYVFLLPVCALKSVPLFGSSELSDCSHSDTQTRT